MKGRNEYMLRFSELIEEQEQFEFGLDNKFFTVFQSDEWEGGNIFAKVAARKRADGITLEVSLSGSLSVVCDRCLEAYPYEIESEEILYIKFGEETEAIDDNIIVVSRDDNQVDLSQFFYEYLVTSLPSKKIHPDLEDGSSGCKKEMLEKLEEHIVKDDSDNIDPRWDDLKKLYNKN